jgi:hypothetical protein
MKLYVRWLIGRARLAGGSVRQRRTAIGRPRPRSDAQALWERMPAGSGPTTQFQNKQKDMILSFISEFIKVLIWNKICKIIEVFVMMTMGFTAT